MNRFGNMSERHHLKDLLDDVLERKNKTMNTIHNDSNIDVERLKVMVEELGVTKESFKTSVTAIVKTCLKSQIIMDA